MLVAVIDQLPKAWAVKDLMLVVAGVLNVLARWVAILDQVIVLVLSNVLVSALVPLFFYLLLHQEAQR